MPIFKSQQLRGSSRGHSTSKNNNDHVSIIKYTRAQPAAAGGTTHQTTMTRIGKRRMDWKKNKKLHEPMKHANETIHEGTSNCLRIYSHIPKMVKRVSHSRPGDDPLRALSETFEGLLKTLQRLLKVFSAPSKGSSEVFQRPSEGFVKVFQRPLKDP